jgi:osmotically-inducible protein OsmY
MPREYRYGRPSSRSDWEDERDYGRGRDEWRGESRTYRSSRRDEDDWRDMNSSLDKQDRDYQGTLRAGDYGRYEEEQPYPPRFQDSNRSSGRSYGESDYGRRGGEGRYGGERDGSRSGYSGGGGYRSIYGESSSGDSNYGGRSRDYGSGGSAGYRGGSSNYGQSGGFGSYTQDYDRKYGSGRYSSGDYNRGDRDYGRGERESGNRERGWWDRATDEVSSWFGDDDAERRRRMDQQHRGRGPKNYNRSDDRIRDDVSDRLTDDPLVDASEIEVTVQNQEVTLTGTVSSRNERRLAEETVEGVSGVKYVQNNLRIRDRYAGGSGSNNTFGSSSTTTM